MSKKPFSKRHKPAPGKLTHRIPVEARNRLVYMLKDDVARLGGNLYAAFEHAASEARKEYALKARANARELIEIAQDHYENCDDEQFIDFLEWAFQSDAYRAGQHGVDIVNNLFRSEGIGYEFSPYVVTTIEIPSPAHYGSGTKSHRYEFQYPEATKKTNEVMHASTVMPALQLLSGPNWKTANEEMLQGHQHLRDGNFADAIHWAGKCLESVLKTIIDSKRWARKPTDTLNALLKTCEAHKLFEAAYLDVIQHSSGRLRNTYSGHGAGPAPAHGPPTYQMAEHMLQITSAHVVLLARLAGMA